MTHIISPEAFKKIPKYIDYLAKGKKILIDLLGVWIEIPKCIGYEKGFTKEQLAAMLVDLNENLKPYAGYILKLYPNMADVNATKQLLKKNKKALNLLHEKKMVIIACTKEEYENFKEFGYPNLRQIDEANILDASTSYYKVCSEEERIESLTPSAEAFRKRGNNAAIWTLPQAIKHVEAELIDCLAMLEKLDSQRPRLNILFNDEKLFPPIANITGERAEEVGRNRDSFVNITFKLKNDFQKVDESTLIESFAKCAFPNQEIKYHFNNNINFPITSSITGRSMITSGTAESDAQNVSDEENNNKNKARKDFSPGSSPPSSSPEMKRRKSSNNDAQLPSESRTPQGSNEKNSRNQDKMLDCYSKTVARMVRRGVDDVDKLKRLITGLVKKEKIDPIDAGAAFFGDIMKENPAASVELVETLMDLYFAELVEYSQCALEGEVKETRDMEQKTGNAVVQNITFFQQRPLSPVNKLNGEQAGYANASSSLSASPSPDTHNIKLFQPSPVNNPQVNGYDKASNGLSVSTLVPP